MRAISLWNPWAMLIALGAKCIETRHWPTDYRGPLAIHAAQRWTRAEREQAYRFGILYPHLAPQLDKLNWVSPNTKGNSYFGAMLCIVRLTDCISTEQAVAAGIMAQERDFGNFAPGRFAWKVELVESLLDNPIPAVGRQGFWNWERPAV